MKRIFFLVLIITLAIGNLIVPGAISASDTDVQSEEILAQKSAQAWLDATAPLIPDLPQWTGARVVLKQQYHDLKGEVNTYLFTIMNKDDAAGFVTVGNSLYNYAFLEASEVSPPDIPTEAEIKTAVESLGLDDSRINISEPIDFIYTGISGFYAVYKICGKDIAINQVSKTATPVADLEYCLPSPEQHHEMKKSLQETKPAIRSSGYNDLELSYYQPGGGACGPCAGVSIGRYYRDVHQPEYSDLYNDYDMYCTLYETMEVTEGAVWPASKFGWGFVVMTYYCNYDNFDYDTDEWVTSGDYWKVVDNIDNGWPVGIVFLIPEFHWRAIRGYGYLTEMDIYNIYCTCSMLPSNYHIVSWGSWELPQNVRLVEIQE